MRYLPLMCLFSFFFIIACVNEEIEKANNEQLCQVDNPLEELVWLKELVEGVKDNPETVEIYQCIYNYQEGFLIDLCVGCPDGLIEFYNCEGTSICEFGGFDGRNTCPDFENSVSNMELIWNQE